MKAEELRIGNWIYDVECEPHYFRVEQLAKHVGYDIWVCYRNNSIKSKLAEPIPLTEEILLKCGFKRGGYDYLFLSNGKFEFSGLNDGYYGIRLNNEYDIELKYLHQLQNLYWCLCGEELEINL